MSGRSSHHLHQRTLNMEFLDALASLAQQHPSTPVVLEVTEVIDLAHRWEATVILRLEDSEDEPIVAEGIGDSAKEALDNLHFMLNSAPIR